MTYILHHAPDTRSLRVLWLMEEMGLDYEIKLRTLESKGSLEFLEISPLGVVPALETGAETILESGAIMQFLLAKHGPTALQIEPDDPGFGAYLQWFHFAEATFTSGLANYMRATRSNAPNVEEARTRLQAQLAYIGEALKTRVYIAGDHFTAADIMLGYTVYAANKSGVLQGAPQALHDYLARLTERPAFGRSAFT